MLQPLNQPVSAVADANGEALFKFESVPNGQYWTGVLSCPLAPVSGQFIATNLGVDYFGLWIANNPFGPMYLPSGQIWVQASGLVPSNTYVVYFTGYVSTGEVTAPVWPMPIANTTIATVVGTVNVNYVAASLPFTYAVSGTVQVPSGATGFLPPQTIPVIGSTTATILGAWVSTRAGTCTLSIDQNGSAIPGLSALAVTDVNTYYATTGSPTFANGDTWSPVVSAASGADGLAVTLVVSFNAS